MYHGKKKTKEETIQIQWKFDKIFFKKEKFSKIWSFDPKISSVSQLGTLYFSKKIHDLKEKTSL